MTTIAGRYELDPIHIGRGGMGEVWGATDTQLRRRVAVKFIRFPGAEPDPELIRRFVREAQLTARMDHPGVPVLYDAAKVTGGPFENRLYLVMQLVDGIGVDDLVAEHDPLPIGWAAAITAQTCAVLAYAHDQRLVHRDLKPSNLMVDKDGAVKVLDFGLAVALDADERSRFTSTGQMLGTLAYMAPEQFQGRSSALSDLYSLGCVLYRMLCGRDPFEGPTQASLMHAQIYEQAVSVRGLRPEVEPGLESLVHRLLAKRPDERPGCADEVYDLLLPHIGELPELPGAVRPGLGSVHRYAGIVSRALGRTPAADLEGPATAQSPVAAPALAQATATDAAAAAAAAAPSDSFSLGDVARAKRQAERLLRQSRYDEAIRMLGNVSERAETVLGAGHSEVTGLRTDLADVLFRAGDYAAAAPAFHALARLVAGRDGTDAESVLRLRLREANCHALKGDTGRALEQLDRLLDDEQRIFGEDDDRVLELRRQIGLLCFGAGRPDAAIRTLQDLVTDLERLHGPDHVTTRNARENLDRMKKP